ncbi:MAG: hypothetical protein ACMUIM_10970 [bacterium]
MKPRKGILQRIIYVLAVIFALLLILIALLPTILSLNPVRRLVLSRVQDAIEGSVRVESWSFGWFTGVKLEDIEFTDPTGLDVKARKISMSTGLIRLLGRTINFGSLTVVEPDISLSMPALLPRDAMQPDRVSEVPSPFRIAFNIKGLFKVQGGRMTIHAGAEKPPLHIEKLDLNLDIRGLDKPIMLDLSAVQPEDLGTIQVKTSLKIIEENQFDPENISGDVLIDITGFDLGPLSRVAGYFAELPDIKGKLNCNINGKIRTLEHADANGSMEIASLLLSGGPLGKDTPSFDMISLAFDMERAGRNLDIKRFDFEAPFAHITASGGLQDQGKRFPSGALTSNGRMDVALILAELPHTLKIREGLRVTNGRIVFSSEVKSSGEVMDMAAQMELSQIKGKQGAQSFALDSPIALSAKGALSETGPRLEHLKLSSAFANASGHGDMENLQIGLSVDLDKAFGELSKFVDLGELRAAGTLNANAGMKSSDRLSKQLDMTVTTRKLSLKGFTPRPIRQDLVQVSVNGLMNLSEENKPRDLKGIAIKLDSSPMTSDIKIEHLEIAPEEKIPAMQNVTASATVDLRKALQMARDMGVMKPGINASGRLDLHCKSGMREGILDIPDLKANITDLIVLLDGKRISEPSVQVRTAARINMASQDVILNSLRLETSPLDLNASGKLTDYKKRKDLVLNGEWGFDFSRISEIVAALYKKEIKMEGKKSQGFSIRTSLAGKTWQEILKKTDASGGLYVKRIKAFGIIANDLETRLDIKDALARASVNTKVNEGDLNITPALDVKGKDPLLTLPDDSQILDKVKLTDEMASDLLALIHPVFRGCAVTGGQMGMRLKECRVPLNENMKKEMVISGDMALANITLTPSGLLQSLMNVIRIEQTPATIPDQTISFVCRDGLIKPSPLKIKVDRYQIILSGTMNYEGMIDYVAEVPVTEKMVSQDIYKYVNTARLKVRIEGPAASPRISRKSLDDTLSNLVKEASKNLLKEKGQDMLKQLFKKL